MALLRIPERLVFGFRILLGLPIETQKALVQYIIDRPIGTTLRTLSENIPSEILGKKEELTIAISILDSLYDAFTGTEFSIDEFVAELLVSLNELKVDIPSAEKFEELVKTLLSNSENQTLTEKFIDLVREGERVILAGRIVTDVRPMVDEDDENSILGLAIVHQLRISFIENNDRKSLFFVLNENDLDELEKIIKRARKKEETFKRTFASETMKFHIEK